MPRYNSRKKASAQRERKRVRAQMPRDKRHLRHWAVSGTHDDYAKFRQHVANVQHRAPSYIEPQALDELGKSTRRSMLENVHKEPWGGGLVLGRPRLGHRPGPRHRELELGEKARAGGHGISDPSR